MPAVGITDGPPPYARDHLARRWVALERRSAWLVVNTQVKACSRKTHSPSRAWIYGHNAFQIIHIQTTVINSGRAHTTQHRTHCGLRLWLQSWLMPQSPHRLRNDLKCVEWDVKPCSVQSIPSRSWLTVRFQRLFRLCGGVRARGLLLACWLRMRLLERHDDIHYISVISRP